MLKLNRNLPFHPVLLAAVPVTMLYVHNRLEVSASSLPVPLVLCVLLVSLSWLVFGFLLRSAVKGAVLASTLAVLFLSFGHFTAATVWYFSEWGQMEPARPQFDWAVLAFIVLVLLTLGAWLWRTTRPLLGLNHFLNVTSAALVLISALNIVLGVSGGSHDRRSAWVPLTGAGHEQPQDSMPVPQIGIRPDVYFILADAHARADVLRDVYGHDGEPFLGELEARGFEVARNSWANYSVTLLAAPAMLNYDYLRDLDGRSRTWERMRERIRDSQLLRRLKAHGYKIVGFETGFEFTKLTDADVIYTPSGAHGNEFYYALLKTTPLPLVFGDISLISEGALKRLDTLFLLETAPHIADDPTPTFAWIHLTIPHAPFVFGPNGENVERRYRNTEDFGANRRTPSQQADYREGYRGQVAFTESMILRMVDEILERSKEPPIILVLSDHGPRLNTIRDENWRDSDLREAMANLTACYFPGENGSASLYDSITPVNVVRIMLNEYFAADLPLVEDRIYHSPYGTSPFWLFEDVTGELLGPGRTEPAPSE